MRVLGSRYVPVLAAAIAWIPAMLVPNTWPWLPDERLPLGAMLVWIAWCVATIGAARTRDHGLAFVFALVVFPTLAFGGAALVLVAYGALSSYSARMGVPYAFRDHFVLMQLGSWPSMLAMGIASVIGAVLSAGEVQRPALRRARSAFVVATAFGAAGYAWAARSRYELVTMLVDDPQSTVFTTSHRVWVFVPTVVALALGLIHSRAARRGA